MNKSKLNYLVDFLTFLFFIIVAFSGLAIFFFMPGGGGRQGRLQEFLGFKKSFWVGLHDWSGIVFIVLVSIHFFLHWDWIVCMSKNIFRSEKCEDKTNNDLKS